MAATIVIAPGFRRCRAPAREDEGDRGEIPPANIRRQPALRAIASNASARGVGLRPARHGLKRSGSVMSSLLRSLRALFALWHRSIRHWAISEVVAISAELIFQAEDDRLALGMAESGSTPPAAFSRRCPAPPRPAPCGETDRPAAAASAPRALATCEIHLFWRSRRRTVLSRIAAYSQRHADRHNSPL